MALSREIHGLSFMHGCFGKLLILTGALLHFLNITQNAFISNGQERLAVQNKSGCSK